MSIHIRNFSIDNPNVIKSIREIGNSVLAYDKENKLCTYGKPEHFRPCFERCYDGCDKSDPLKVAQVASWPLAFPGMVSRGRNNPNVRPPSGCTSCAPCNKDNCLGKTNGKPSCIFSVCERKIIRPQFVFVGKNWSADIVNDSIDKTCWGNGNNIQAKHLKGTVFEGGYFTDFVKGVSKTYFPDMKSWLLQKDPLLNNKRRFEVFLEVFKQELELLQTHFDLTGTDRYIVIWGVSLFNDLNQVSQEVYRCDFAQLPCFYDGEKRKRYEIRLFGAHYSPQGSVLKSLRGAPASEIRTIRRIYEDIEKRKADNEVDNRGFDFEIMPDGTIPPKEIVLLD